MHSDQLHYLITLSKNSSINIASQQLHITPSALSISIKNLENELEIPLLIRSSRGITFTKQGQKIVRIAEAFFQELQQVKDQVENDKQTEPSGECYVYAVQGALDDLLPKVICDFYERHPLLHVTVETANAAEIVQRLETDLSDKHEFALVFTRLLESGTSYIGKNCTFTPLTQAKLFAQIHERFPIAHTKTLSIKTILAYPILIYNPSTQLPEDNPSLKMLCSIATPQKIILESNYQIYQNMLQRGIGIGFDIISPLISLSSPKLKNIHNVFIKDCPTLHLGYVVNNAHTLSVPAQIFLDFLVGFIKRNDFLGQS